jgi:hypothetical protein
MHLWVKTDRVHLILLEITICAISNTISEDCHFIHFVQFPVVYNGRVNMNPTIPSWIKAKVSWVQ